MLKRWKYNQWLAMKDCIAKPKSIQERVICERAVLPKLFWGGWYWGELHMISRRIRLFETVAGFVSKRPGRQCEKIWAQEFAESWAVLRWRNKKGVWRCLCVCILVETTLLSGREYSAAGQMPREISLPIVSAKSVNSWRKTADWSV